MEIIPPKKKLAIIAGRYLGSSTPDSCLEKINIIPNIRTIIEIRPPTAANFYRFIRFKSLLNVNFSRYADVEILVPKPRPNNGDPTIIIIFLLDFFLSCQIGHWQP